MLKAFRYELKPTDEQRQSLSQMIGNARFIFNAVLETKIAAYQSSAKYSYSYNELANQLPDAKNLEGFEWLKKSDSQSLQVATKNVIRAFDNFFDRGCKGFPKFKKKKNGGKVSFPTGSSIKVDFDKWEVKLPKLGAITLCHDRKLYGTIKQATITKTPTFRYFISILVDTQTEKPILKPIQTSTTVGIDVGLKHFATFSDGSNINNPKFLFHNLKRLKIEQRKSSRRFKKITKKEREEGKTQSKSYEKQALRVAKLHEKIANQRKDFLHKVSTAITKQYDTIVVEDLNIKGMIKNNKLSRSIADVGWGYFTTFLKYKCEWYGKNYIEIGRFEPSSKLCSCCGTKKESLELSERTWECENCGTTHDRDVNAAINIKNLGLRVKPLYAKTEH